MREEVDRSRNLDDGYKLDKKIRENGIIDIILNTGQYPRKQSKAYKGKEVMNLMLIHSRENYLKKNIDKL